MEIYWDKKSGLVFVFVDVCILLFCYKKSAKIALGSDGILGFLAASRWPNPPLTMAFPDRLSLAYLCEL